MHAVDAKLRRRSGVYEKRGLVCLDFVFAFLEGRKPVSFQRISGGECANATEFSSLTLYRS